MSRTYFFTGFPGFIARALVNEIIEKGYPLQHIYLLVEPHMKEIAEREVRKISVNEKVHPEQFSVVAGDITVPDLGLSEAMKRELSAAVTHVFHLAAVYDLAVPKEIAERVNVKGTKHVNDWVKSLAKLERYIYFSTAFVSGNRQGQILEKELEMGQTFKNHYEQTKYEAEILVRRLIPDVPVTIIRPGVVKGHSQTGETIKFDGPYFMLNLFERLKFLPFIPYFGYGKADGNFVPVDYIYEATVYLAHHPVGEGKTYHLTDPHPYSMRDIYKMLMKESVGRRPVGIIPLRTAKGLLSLSVFRKWLGVEKEAVDYFGCRSYYDSSQAEADLQGSGVVQPNFAEQIQSMVSYYKKHKHDKTKHIIIR